MDNYEMLKERYEDLRLAYDELSAVRYELESYKADIEYAWKGGASYEVSNAIDNIKHKIDVVNAILDEISRKLLLKAEESN